MKNNYIFRVKDCMATKINDTLRHTYMLLSLTIIFSAFMAFLGIKFNFVRINIFLTLFIFYGLLFLIHYFKQSLLGLFLVFIFTGFMGLSLSVHLTPLLSTKHGIESIIFSLFLTGFIFSILSMYVLITRKNFDFLSSFLFIGFIIILICSVVCLFKYIPLLHVIISGFFIFFSSGMILYETSRIVRDGETNYILATVSLYVQIYNMFISILSIFNFLSGKD